MWQEAKRGQPRNGGDAGRMPESAGPGQLMALALTLMAMTQRPVRPAFARQADAANVLTMVAGFALMGIQITGAFVA